MSEQDLSSPGALLPAVAEAIRRARRAIVWKPGKAQTHLAKRISRGHLSPETTLAEYETIIRSVLLNAKADVYVYQFGPAYYPTVVAWQAGRLWLVMLNRDGILETAFPPDGPDAYFSQEPRYQWLGRAAEIAP